MKLYIFFVFLLFKLKVVCYFNGWSIGICEDICPKMNGNRTKNCFCDQCDIFDDCCANIPKVFETLKNYECNIQVNDNQFIYSISKCPVKYSDHVIKGKCEKDNKRASFLNFLPVFSNQTSLTYRNIYCARCNIKKFELNETIPFYIDINKLFKEKIRYKSLRLVNLNLSQINNLISFLTLENFDLMRFKLNGTKSLRPCLKNLISKCPENRKKEEHLKCESYTSYRENANTPKIFYKNKDCAFCNGILSERSLKCEVMEKNFYTKSWAPKKQDNLQILFDLNTFYSVDLKIKLGDTIIDSIRIYDDSFIKEEIKETINKTNIKFNENNINYVLKKYFTLAGLSISIISILLLIFFYCSNEKLRNFPGKLLIRLSISLLFSQSFFIISNYLTRPVIVITELIENGTSYNKLNGNLFENVWSTCYITGMLTHYFYLAFFLWSNILAFDLYKMLSSLVNNKNRTDYGELRTFICYSIYAWLIPFGLIICLFLKQFLVNSSYLSYGINSCFITKKIDFILFFVLPVNLILLINFYLLLRSIVFIRSVDNNSKKYLKKDEEEMDIIESNDNKEFKIFKNKNIKNEKKCCINVKNIGKNRFVLYLKLFFVTGVCWLLGILCSFINNSILWYAYIILNSLQGLTILISFTYNPKSILFPKNALYRKRLVFLFEKRFLSFKSSTQI